MKRSQKREMRKGRFLYKTNPPNKLCLRILKLDGNYTKMKRAVLIKPQQQQLYGHSLPIPKMRARYVGHCCITTIMITTPLVNAFVLIGWFLDLAYKLSPCFVDFFKLKRSILRHNL